MTSTPKLVTVSSYINAWDARIASGRLEAEGIPTIIVDENYILQNWAISQALGGVKIQVPVDRADEAKKIIAALGKDEFAQILDAEMGNTAIPSCPKCASHDIKARFSFRSWMLMLGTLIAGAGYPARRNLQKCQECGYEWRE